MDEIWKPIPIHRHTICCTRSARWTSRNAYQKMRIAQIQQ